MRDPLNRFLPCPARCGAGLLIVLALWCAGCAGRSPAATPSLSGTGAAARPQYNVVLVSFDAMRAQETSLYGYPRDTTPNLKKFAASAVVFQNATAPASWTLPGTMAVFTGLYPSVHGVVNKLMPDAEGRAESASLSPSITTLPQLLHRHGYILGGFTGDAGVGGHFGYGRDFDTYLDDVKFGGFAHSVPAAIGWVKKHQGEKFFLFLHGYDCHGQYDPPEGYRRTFVGAYRGGLKGGKDEQARFREQALKNKFTDKTPGEPYLPEKAFSAADGRFYQALYDEKIHRADAQFATFLDAMDRMGLTNKTIFVLLADHGEEFLEHGNLDHGPTLYQEMIHVPLVIKIPGMPARTVAQRVSSMDALPTVLDFLGVPMPHLDAVSVLPLMDGKPMAAQAVFSETDYRLYSHKRAAFQGDLKLIHSLDSERWELYDLSRDPAEKHPLPLARNAAAQSLRRALEEWEKGLPRRFPDYESDAAKTIKVY